MQFPTIALLASLAITPTLSLPTQLQNLANLLSREDSTEAFLTGYSDPNCAARPKSIIHLPLPPNFTLASNASQSICHPLPAEFRHKEFATLNFGSGEDAIPCGLSLFKDAECTEYAAHNWYRRDPQCQNVREVAGGPWGGVSFSGCWGDGTPNGKPTDDPNVDPNEGNDV